MQTLTEKQRERYVASGATTCPYCGSSQLPGGVMAWGGDSPTHSIKCGGCEREWQDENERSGITLDETDAPHA